MKQIFFLLATNCLLLQLYGQGTVQISNGTSVKTAGGAYLVLETMHLVNNGSLQQDKGDGSLKFAGTGNVNLSGNGITIDSLLLAKASTSNLTLQANTGVLSKLYFGGGLLNLGNNNIDLGTTGMLTGESESSRAFTTGSGYIQWAGTINAPSAVNPGNLGAFISAAANLGATTIKRGHAMQQIAPGSYSIQRYYDITPTDNTNLSATLRFQYFDAELNGLPESSLDMWRGNGSTWTNLGSNTRDAAANFLEKQNIQSFDRMSLAVACSMTATIADVYAVTPGGAANTLYIGYGPASLTLVGTVIGGASPYTYRWTVGSPGGTRVGTSATLTVRPGTTTIYYLSVSDATGCSAPAVSKTITVMDVRCGAKLNQVTVCIFQKGSYTTQCVATSKVKGYLNAGGYLGTCVPAVNPAVTQSNAVTKAVNQLSVRVVPNPSMYSFRVTTQSKVIQPLTLRVVDAAGRVIETRQGLAANGTITIGALYRPGVYYLEVIQGNERVAAKLVKQPD